MTTSVAPARTVLTVAAAVLAALVATRLLVRFVGFAVLLGVVGGCVGALTIGVLLLKAAAGL